MSTKRVLSTAFICLFVAGCGSSSESSAPKSDKISSSDAEAIFDKKCIALTVERLPLQFYSNDDAVQACLAVKMDLQKKGKFDGLTERQANRVARRNWKDIAGVAEVFRTQAQ